HHAEGAGAGAARKAEAKGGAGEARERGAGGILDNDGHRVGVARGDGGGGKADGGVGAADRLTAECEKVGGRWGRNPVAEKVRSLITGGDGFGQVGIDGIVNLVDFVDPRLDLDVHRARTAWYDGGEVGVVHVRDRRGRGAAEKDG